MIRSSLVIALVPIVTSISLASAPSFGAANQVSVAKFQSVLCQNVPVEMDEACFRIFGQTPDVSGGLDLDIKALRKHWLANFRGPESNAFIESAFYSRRPDSESTRLRISMWRDFKVIVFDAGVVTPLGLTRAWRVQDLRLLRAGYVKLHEAVSRAVGPDQVEDYSHIWGAYGSVARIGRKTISGQFGEVNSSFSFQINIVTNIAADRFSALTLAQRIAHEASHSNDHLLGRALSGRDYAWSELPGALVFSACGLTASYDTSLESCRHRYPAWFRFHSTSYAATRSSEFYGKMVDEWVRMELGVKKVGAYSCQSANTLSFWNEMRTRLLGLPEAGCR